MGAATEMVFGLEANSANSDLRVLVLAPFGKDATLIKAVLDDSKIASHRVLGVSDLGGCRGRRRHRGDFARPGRRPASKPSL
jgi:hypothetical protein